MVYLVDDDVDDLEIVQEALITHSYKGPVITASNGKVLMDQLNNQHFLSRPDVILLDLNMPLKNGFQALQEIKDDPSLKSIPVIILTASSRKEDEARCFELGCSFYFTKPSKLSDYVDLVSLVKKFIVNQS
jgi:CheY-like chemotaxis protein